MESKWELSWLPECFPWAIVVSEGVCVVPTVNSHSTNIWTSLQQLRLVTLLGHSSLGGSNEKVVELKEMLQTDVLQNIDHCETVAGGSNHRFLRGLWDICGGEILKGSLQSKNRRTKLSPSVFPPYILHLYQKYLQCKQKVWFGSWSSVAVMRFLN